MNKQLLLAFGLLFGLQSESVNASFDCCKQDMSCCQKIYHNNICNKLCKKLCKANIKKHIKKLRMLHKLKAHLKAKARTISFYDPQAFPAFKKAKLHKFHKRHFKGFSKHYKLHKR